MSEASPHRLPPKDVGLAIERRFPGLHRRLPRVCLTALPTRVHQLTRLAQKIGAEQLWIKRDDESGPLYGGNKPRKLEFVLGDAVARGRKTVLTFGGIGTHHGLATAVCARSVGLQTILLLLRQPVTEHVRRCLLLDHAAGAELHYASTVPLLVVQALRVCARRLLHGEVPYLIPTGGSSALGTLGYVNAALELQEQITTGEVPEPDCIFVPLGSGGTVVGLTLGAKLAGLRSRVVAVLVTDILPPSPAILARHARKALAVLQGRLPELQAPAITAADFTIRSGYLGSGYGAPTEAGRHARDLMAQLEDIHLDTTYSAKCLAAMMDAVRSGEYCSGPVLFWNTYSSVDAGAQFPSLPDYRRLPHPFHRFFTGAAVPA